MAWRTALSRLETRLGPTSLEIHFNTLTIASDMQCLLEGDPGRDTPIYEVEILSVGYLPLRLCEDDVRTVAK